jgi:hypothetical protein
MNRPFHIEDRALGRIVATGEIDVDGRVIWDETEARDRKSTRLNSSH